MPNVKCPNESRGMLDCAAGGAGRCGIDCQHSSGKLLPVQPFNRGCQIGSILKFDEAEASGMACLAIAYHLCERDGVPLFFEPLPQFCFAARVRYISNK